MKKGSEVMPTYYIDMETTGLNELDNKIITIQYAELKREFGKNEYGEEVWINSAQMVEPLTILKEWESDEKTILKKFFQDSGILDTYAFSFVGLGYNLQFEQKFLWQRAMTNGLKPINLLSKPFIDLHTVGILMNKGEFRGSGMDKITNKPHDGKIVVDWYNQGNYKNIESYIKNETESFLQLYGWLLDKTPNLLDEFKNDPK